MTDNEIIKALDSVGTATGVALGHHSGQADIIADRFRELIDEINRQKAEIERLQKDLTKCKLEKEMMYRVADEIKSVAIKEFAGRLKSKIWHSPECNYISSITPDYIDNLVKEMTEENKNDRA